MFQKQSNNGKKIRVWLLKCMGNQWIKHKFLKLLTAFFCPSSCTVFSICRLTWLPTWTSLIAYVSKKVLLRQTELSVVGC